LIIVSAFDAYILATKFKNEKLPEPKKRPVLTIVCIIVLLLVIILGSYFTWQDLQGNSVNWKSKIFSKQPKYSLTQDELNLLSLEQGDYFTYEFNPPYEPHNQAYSYEYWTEDGNMIEIEVSVFDSMKDAQDVYQKDKKVYDNVLTVSDLGDMSFVYTDYSSDNKLEFVLKNVKVEVRWSNQAQLTKVTNLTKIMEQKITLAGK
jgi:hypothetical protein